MKRLINFIKNFIKKHVFIRKIARKIWFCKNKLKYNFIAKRIEVDEKLIVFASFNGRSYCDSPKALYKHMINDERYAEYKFVWAFKNYENYKFLEENKNTKVIPIKSKKFMKILAKAKYWIFNYKIQDYIFPKENQVFVQCWHGTPLKRLGCDLEHFNNAMNSISEIRRRYQIEASKFSYFLSPSKFATEKFMTAWDMKDKSIMLEEGYPRNDFLINYTEDDKKAIKKRLNLSNVNKKIILYAPTYRDNQHTAGVGYTYKSEIDFDKLKEQLSDEYIILFRTHWLVAQSFDFDKYKDFIVNVSDYDDINELYVISDMLITDYSSVFFDYANLKRPIIFYMYDLKEYKDDIRGFYLSLEELPGNIIETDIELIDEIKNIQNSFKYDEKYKAFNNKFNYLDDGKASNRVIDKILK